MDDKATEQRLLEAVARFEAQLEESAASDEGDEAEEEVPQRGEVLVAIPRHGKREQLRVVFDTWNGCEFATLRLWWRSPDEPKTYLPTHRGVTIRRREFARVLSALHEIARRLGVEGSDAPGAANTSLPPAT